MREVLDAHASRAEPAAIPARGAVQLPEGPAVTARAMTGAPEHRARPRTAWSLRDHRAPGKHLRLPRRQPGARTTVHRRGRCPRPADGRRVHRAVERRRPRWTAGRSGQRCAVERRLRHRVVPRQLSYQELAHDGVSRLLVVDTMHERKQLMQALSQGCIELPGGSARWKRSSSPCAGRSALWSCTRNRAASRTSTATTTTCSSSSIRRPHVGCCCHTTARSPGRRARRGGAARDSDSEGVGRG